MTPIAAPSSLSSAHERERKLAQVPGCRFEGEDGAADQYDGDKDFAGSYELALATIRARKADGGPGWEPK